MEFYVVNNTAFEDNGFVYGEEIGKVNTGDAVKCEECGSFLTGLEWLPPFEIKLSKGKLGDIIFGTFDHFIVSERFKEVYEENGFKGMHSFEPATLYQRGKQINQKYYYPKITLSKVHVDIEKSGIIFDGVGECATCQKAGRVIKNINGLYFNDEEKIEEDIFCTKMLPGTITITEDFKEAAMDLLNLTFTNAKRYVPSWII